MQRVFNHLTKFAIILSVTVAGAMTLSVPHANAASLLSPVIDPVISLLTPTTTPASPTTPIVTAPSSASTTTPTANTTTPAASTGSPTSSSSQTVTPSTSTPTVVPFSNTVPVDPKTNTVKSLISPSSFDQQTTPAVYKKGTTDGFAKLTARQKTLGGLSALTALVIGALLFSLSQVAPNQKLLSLLVGTRAL